MRGIPESIRRPYTARCRVALACAVAALSVPAPAADPATGVAPEITRAQQLWRKSAHGPMHERILPPAVTPAELPEPQSEGARLVTRYCVQCHHLPNPRMHTAEKWADIVERMVWRMRGQGNMGRLMKEMMAGIEAPTGDEVATVTRYLAQHSQKEIDPAHPGLKTEAGKMFSIACSQCHAAPDPLQHTSREWPAIVERMKRHMAWANVVVGARELRTVPELRTEEIVRFLQRHARKGARR